MQLAPSLLAGVKIPSSLHGQIRTDASALPVDRQFIADALAARVNSRATENSSALTVAYRLDPSLGGETARVTVKGDRAEIVAARPRALYYGMGRLMREMRWTAGGFTLADGTWEVKPVKPLRVAYWARHFHNWYHTSSAAELKRYAEDMLLNGVNCLNYQYFYPAVNVAGARPDEVATFERNSKMLYDHLVAMDADYLAFGGGNQLPADSPEEYRGVPETDWRRGNLGFNACPAKPKALKAMLDGRNRGIDRSLKDGVKPSWFLNWPFDEGGCECEKCRPWGGNGFIGLCRQFDEINKRRVPGCKTMLATWTYHDDDYAGLWEYLKKPESAWIDGLMIDDHEDFPKWPLKHGIPRNLPVITFPEISMWGRWPWGGTGAIAMPARFERLFRQAEKVASGFMFYSEGLSEDVNKFVVTGLYVDPTRHWQELVRDYACQWLPGLDAERFIELVTLMEKTQKNPIWERLNGKCSDEKAAAFLSTSIRMRDLVRTLEMGLLPSERMAWRWRLIRLRTEIEAQLWTPGGDGSEELRKCFREVNEIYHAEPNAGDYHDNTHISVRAPLKMVSRPVRAAETHKLELGALFKDHAVVQRDKRVAVWGKGAKPFARVEATLGKVKGATRAASDGSFMFRLAPQPAGGPFVLSVKDESGRTAAASDVYVGEVWLAAGQEEMELRMRSCEPGADPGDHPLIRQFTVSVEGAFRPLAEPRGTWAVATEGAIPDFCGIGYFFAQELQRKFPGVAVGIIQSALGGTSILSWSSRSCLMGVPGAVREVEQYEKDAEDVRVWDAKPQPMADFGPAEAEAKGWARADFDDAGWRKVKLPNEDLDCGVFGRSFHGAAWFRRRVTLPKRWEGRDLVMLGGRIDKQDRAYLGGECVGVSGKGFEQLFWNVLRRYRIPAAKVKAGETVVAIRVWSHQLGFGIHGKPEELCLAPADDPKDVLPLAGEWRVAIERDIGDVQYARTTLPGNPCAPYALYDAAIAPLVPYSLRGFLWYQGYVEINMGRIGLYRALQTAMVRDWRRAWGDGDLPFILMSLDGSGVEASMLKAQAGTAEDLANVGVISTVGTRVAGDDEKRNMRKIARRASEWAIREKKDNK